MLYDLKHIAGIRNHQGDPGHQVKLATLQIPKAAIMAVTKYIAPVHVKIEEKTDFTTRNYQLLQDRNHGRFITPDLKMLRHKKIGQTVKNYGNCYQDYREEQESLCTANYHLIREEISLH